MTEITEPGLITYMFVAFANLQAQILCELSWMPMLVHSNDCLHHARSLFAKRACKAKTMMRLPGFLPCRVLSRTIGYADIRDVEVMRSHLVPKDAQRVVWNLCPRQQRSEGRQYRDRHGKSNRLTLRTLRQTVLESARDSPLLLKLTTSLWVRPGRA